MIFFTQQLDELASGKRSSKQKLDQFCTVFYIFSRRAIAGESMCTEQTISCSPVYKSFKFSDDNEGMKKAQAEAKSSLEDFCVTNLKSQDCKLVPNPTCIERKKNGNDTQIATEDEDDGKDNIEEDFSTKNDSEDCKERKCRGANKGSTDYELPELVVFLQDSNYHFVKDICIDKKMQSHGKCSVENCELDHKIISCILDSEAESKSEMRMQNVVAQPSISMESKTTADEGNNNSNKNKTGSTHCGSAILLTQGLVLDSKDEISVEKSTREIVPESLLLVAEAKQAGLTSSMVTIAIEKSDDTSPVSTTIPIPKEAERRNNPFEFDNDLSMPTTSVTEELSQCPKSNQQDPDIGKDHGNEDRSMLERHQNYSEASTLFASGQYSGLISQHGSAAPSFRSASHRSNSSTTSSRSFAFPILASEWHGSPERMETPDKRHSKKRKSKCARFLCFKF